MTGELSKLLELVNAHYRLHHQTSFYARHLGLRSQELNRLCRDELGISVRDVVAGKLMERAREMLRAESTGEVADALGFGSLSGFNGFFKRHAGCSAAQYKKRFLH